ncbi:TetR/AcrR family transcriptional regulator [Stenotrophomonas sp.]|uniref:TetR/AcrR family transcriptional regulator n=1 Tax=Stenotrophomonas sp. TaxID=69392 RepID=UPI002FC5C146
MSSPPVDPSCAAPRRRLTRADRLQQLLAHAWQLVREEGTEALSLGRLAEQAGVTKPVVYDHFGTRAGLLAALYRDFDQRQGVVMDAALAASGPALQDKADVIAQAYVACVQTQGREIPGVIAALAGSPELARIKREYEAIFIEQCRTLLAPFARAGTLPSAGLWAMLGAAEGVSYAAVNGDITAHQAQQELAATIMAMVARA